MVRTRSVATYANTVARLLLSGKINRLFSVPTMLREIMTQLQTLTNNDREELKRRLSNLTVIVSRGEPLEDVVAKLIVEVTGIMPDNGYGRSETPNVTQKTRRIKKRHDKLPVGIVGPGVLMHLLDRDAENEWSNKGAVKYPFGETGLLAFSTPASMIELGYLGNEEATRKETFNKTFILADVFKVLGNGRLQFVDRAKNMINRGGRNVSPGEIKRKAQTVLKDKDVSAVVVFGGRLLAPGLEEIDDTLR